MKDIQVFSKVLYAIGVIFNPIKSEEKFYIATVETFKY
jgi:hypothetical protein